MKKKIMAAISLLLVGTLISSGLAMTTEAAKDTGADPEIVATNMVFGGDVKQYGESDVTIEAKTALEALPNGTDVINSIYKKGASGVYEPTNIINGKFDTHPLFYGVDRDAADGFANDFQAALSKAEKVLPDATSNPANLAGLYDATPVASPGDDMKITITGVSESGGDVVVTMEAGKYPGSVYKLTIDKNKAKNWQTTSTEKGGSGVSTDKGLPVYEWVSGYLGHGLWANNAAYKNSHKDGSYFLHREGGGYGADNFNPFVELNAEEPSTLYQDLPTTGRDIIIWQLRHGSRDNANADNRQEIQVEMGPIDAGVTPTKDNSGIQAGDHKTVFTYTTVVSNDGYSKTSDVAGLYIADPKSDTWGKAQGIYIVPEGQDETRFAFRAVGQGKMGNFLDDVIFDTLIGNIKQSKDLTEDKIIVTGIWGGKDLNVNDDLKKFIYDILDDDNNVIAQAVINMKDVENGPFRAVIDVDPEVKANASLDNSVLIPERYHDVVAGADVTITYDTKGVNPGESTDPKTVAMGAYPGDAPLESNKTYNGYKFLGWFNDESYTSPYTPANLDSNKTVYAKWTKLAEVTFESKIGSTVLDVPNKQMGFDPDTPDYAKDPVGDDTNTTATKTMYTEGAEYTVDGKVYKFEGWYENEGFTGDKFVFGDTGTGITDINADTTLYAKWTFVRNVPSGGGYIPPSPKPAVKLEFETEIGPKPDTQSGITPGTTGKDPSSLKPGDEVDGNIFQGWFLDPDGKIPFDFSKPIDKDTKVYAKWEKKSDSGTEKPDGETTPDGTTPDGTTPDGTTPDGTTPDGTTPDGTTPDSTPNGTTGDTGEKVKVTFKTDIGVTPEAQSVVPGNTAVDPQAPMDPTTLQPGTVINGYRFEGWFLDPEFKTAFDFKSAIREDTVLYAKWVKVGTKNQSPKTGVEDYYGIFAIVIAALGLVGFISLKPRKRDRFS